MSGRYIRCFVLAALGLLLLFNPLYSQSWKHYPYSPEGSVFTFPRDEGFHPGHIAEWWYMAGHLYGKATGTHYSYMLTYIYYPSFGFDGYRMMVLTNEDTGEFYYETVPLFYDSLDTLSLNLQVRFLNDSIDFWTTRQDKDENLIPFEYDISARGEHGKLELGCVSLKPPLVLGDSGIINQGSDSYTYYYSLTENNVDGFLNFKGLEEEVSGTAWIDRQYGNFNRTTGERYEWFYVNLSNGMDLNIANIFTSERQIPDHQDYRLITAYVDSATQYSNHLFDIERLEYAYSPDSVTCYSQKWHLTSRENQLDLIISAVHSHTEVQVPVRFYEGSVTVTGTVNGVPVDGIGFAELLVHYEPPKVNFTGPPAGFWTDSVPITWHLQDPNDGRQVIYNLEYSLKRDGIFSMIEYGLEDTTYLWQDPPLISGDSIWFKLTAYSVDSTLLSTIISDGLIYHPEGTGIRDLSYDSEELALILYPNPATDKLYFESELDLSDQSYQIIDYTGRQVSGGVLSNQVLSSGIDIHELANGLYFIRIELIEGPIVRSFVVE
ncbi:MAG: lipocalin-like domain-containing protein [Bacteroidota bacterium]